MHWHTKAVVHNIISYLPLFSGFHYTMQRRITGTLPQSAAKALERITLYKRHIELLTRYAQPRLESMVFYEFGAGWDLMGPLTFSAMGVSRQIVTDLNPLLRVELLNDSIRKLFTLCCDCVRRPGAFIECNRDRGKRSLKALYGIDYMAPCDARSTGLASSSVDCITSTNTLEHIPEADIPAILAESQRILRVGGLASLRIDYQDHFSYFDRSISVYNFLKYSDLEWKIWSPPSHYQNRLRHPDYKRLIAAGGFELLVEQPEPPTEEDLKSLWDIRLARRFRCYDLRDLGVRSSFFVARKTA